MQSGQLPWAGGSEEGIARGILIQLRERFLTVSLSHLLFQRPKGTCREEGEKKRGSPAVTSRAVPSGNDVTSPGSCKYHTLRKKLQGQSTLILAGFMLFRGQ